MEIKEGTIVRVNIPEQAQFIKAAAAKRHYNHKSAKVIEVDKNKYRLNVDDGYHLWEPEILCVAMSKKC